MADKFRSRRPKVELLDGDKREFLRDMEDAVPKATFALAIYELNGRYRITCTGLDSRHRIAGALADLQHWVLIDAASPDEDEESGAS